MKGEHDRRIFRLSRGLRGVVTALLICTLAGVSSASGDGGEGKTGPKWMTWLGFEEHRTSRISDESAPVVDEDIVPDRPLRLELGNAFVGTGPISEGWTLPTGATWTPSLLVWGAHRTALQIFDNGRPTTDFGEWANRLDIYANLILSGTERVLVGFRPFDEGFSGPSPTSGRFTGYYFNPGHGDFKQEFNADLITLFFEGEISELLPRLDPEDKYPLDISFTVGRQQIFAQEGILLFDFMDAVGVSKNSIRLPGFSNLQVSFLYAWNEINRGDNFEVNNLDLYAVFFALDHPWSTINFDLVYANDREDDEDGFYVGLSFVQRIGHYSTAFRAVASIATDEIPDRIGPTGQGPTSRVDTGVVLFLEIGKQLAWSRNNVYATFFAGINDYTPAARTPGTGGPMGRAGLNFAGQGLGRYAAPVMNFAQDAVGGALGFQAVLDGELARRQVIFELGARKTTNNANTDTISLLSRFQQAFGRHTLLQLDLFGSVGDDRSPGWGGRMEWRYSF